MKDINIYDEKEYGFVACLHYNLLESILSLNLNETRVLLAIISLIDKEGDSFDTYKIYTYSASKLLNMDTDNAYVAIKKAVSFFTDKVISIKDPKKNIPKDYQVFSKIKYINGELSFKINNTMKPLLLNLKDNFICVKPKEIPYLNSKYSIRFYLLVKGIINSPGNGG
jgi:plasmid replication initiation protein